MSAIDPAAIVGTLAEMEFRELAKFDAGHAGVFWSEEGGPSPWEMHPECDEMLQILAGEIEVEVLPQDGGPGVMTKVAAGEFIVIPRGHWHRQTMLSRTQEFFLTPGPSAHSTSVDPRKEALT